MDVKGRGGGERKWPGGVDVWQTGPHISIWTAEHGPGESALVSWILIVEKGMLRRGWRAMGSNGRMRRS